jgi:hypothetical protein
MMMFFRLYQVIHGWLGWCPDREMAPFRKETVPWPDMNSLSLPMNGAFVKDGIIVDYRKTGISWPFFIGSVIGIIGIAAFLLIIVQIAFFTLAGTLFCGLIALVAIIIVYRDLKKARLEIAPDTLIIRRSLHQPVVIPRATISSVGIQPNVPSFSLWLQKVLVLFIIPVSSAGVIYGEYLQFLAGGSTWVSFSQRLIFNISIILFILVIYHHNRIRSDYPEMLVITTKTQNIAVIYGKDPEEIAKTLGNTI